MSSIPPDPARPVVASAQPDRPHAPPTDEEAIYYQGSPLLGGQPEKVLGLALLATFFLIVPILVKVLGRNHTWPDKYIVIVLEVIGLVLWLVPIIITKSISYRISNYRIDFERGIVAKDISTLELWHVEDISFHQSIFDRILSIGTIRVISHDDSMPDIKMRGLPDARRLFEELKQRIIAVKRQSGVLKLDSGT